MPSISSRLPFSCAFSKQRFGVAQSNHRALAARYRQFGISRRQVSLIEQQGRLRVRRGRALAVPLDPLRCARRHRALRLLLHHRDRARHQHPARMHIARLAPRRRARSPPPASTSNRRTRAAAHPHGCCSRRMHPVARTRRIISAHVAARDHLPANRIRRARTSTCSPYPPHAPHPYRLAAESVCSVICASGACLRNSTPLPRLRSSPRAETP